MRIVGSVLLQYFSNRIVNIHPALLPSFPGLHAIEQAFHYGVKIFGITIHYVDEGVDTGKIIAQDCFHAGEDMTLEEVETHIHQLEHQLYPKTIQKLITCKKKS
jgi:phosphoribosylglycinamide formyltransferase-1